MKWSDSGRKARGKSKKDQSGIDAGASACRTLTLHTACPYLSKKYQRRRENQAQQESRARILYGIHDRGQRIARECTQPFVTPDEPRQGRRYTVVERDKCPACGIGQEMPVPEVSQRPDMRVKRCTPGRCRDEAPAVPPARDHLHIRRH